jgi:hypothetical protein
MKNMTLKIKIFRLDLAIKIIVKNIIIVKLKIIKIVKMNKFKIIVRMSRAMKLIIIKYRMKFLIEKN